VTTTVAAATAMETAAATMTAAATLGHGRYRRHEKSRCYCNTKSFHLNSPTGSHTK